MRKLFTNLFCLGGFLSLSSAKTPTPLPKVSNTSRVDPAELTRVIDTAQQNSWNVIQDNNTWVLPPYLGTMFSSEYYFELKALGLESQSKFNQTYFTQLLLDTQLPDGSWEQVHEQNLKTGILDSTVYNYWYLKSVGVDPNSSMMVKCKDWVLAHGGIEALQTMSKMKLAIFGHYDWTQFMDIPLMLFKKTGIFKSAYVKNIVAQWVYPHLTALTYLRHFRVVFNEGAEISELWKGTPKYHFKVPDLGYFEPDSDVLTLIDEMLALRQKRGSFGGYTISTLLTMLAFRDFQSRFPHVHTEAMKESIQKGFEFVEFNYFNDLVPYQGTLDDGRWWDTILVSWGLLEAGTDPSKLVHVMDHMIAEGVQSNGGIAYGYDFEYAPDADDTGLLILVLSKFGDRYANTIEKAQKWLFSMQNPDGGFPAFDTNKMEDHKLFKFAMDFIGISNSAEIFDPSSPDVTTHILEGFAATGVGLDTQVVQNAIQYLKDTQAAWGSWQGRWGINYIYSMGCVLPGLSRIGYNLKEEWIEHSINWLKSRQNADGGFGETTISYNDANNHNGRGVSTVSQTAWGLLAYLEVAHIYNVSENIELAASFLVSEFTRLGDRFFDISVVGTGHRGVLYLQYPSYAYSFPLVALSRYRSYISGQFPPAVNNTVQVTHKPAIHKKRKFLSLF